MKIAHNTCPDAILNSGLYFRAKLLDNVIDVLVDYIEAEQVPEHREEAQPKARAVHLLSDPQYLTKYGVNFFGSTLNAPYYLYRECIPLGSAAYPYQKSQS